MFVDILDVNIELLIARMTYSEAMNLVINQTPFDMELVNVSEVVKDSEFGGFLLQ